MYAVFDKHRSQNNDSKDQSMAVQPVDLWKKTSVSDWLLILNVIKMRQQNHLPDDLCETYKTCYKNNPMVSIKGRLTLNAVKRKSIV